MHSTPELVPQIPPIPDGELPAIAVGILSFNRSAEVLRTLELFLESDYPADKLHLIVIDNASTDGTAAQVRARFGSSVEVLRLDHNIGTLARNHVLLHRDERYVFCFDEDCAPADVETIRRAVEIMEAVPRIGAVCFRSINQHTGQTEWGDFRRIAHRRIGEWGYEGLSVIGNGMGFRGEAIGRTIGYDAKMFWGGEELQLGLEMLYHDIPIVYVPDLAIVHRHAPRALSRAEATEMYVRNSVLTLVTYFPMPLAALAIALQSARSAMASLLRRRGRGIAAVVRGIRRGIAELDEVLDDRRVIPLSRLAGYNRWLIASLSVAPAVAPEPRDAERIARSRRPLPTAGRHDTVAADSAA